MGIYWRGKGKEKTAWGRIRIRGEEYRGTLGTSSKRDAPAAFQEWAAKLRADLKAQRPVAGEITWRGAVDHFIEHHFPTIEESTQDRYLISMELLAPHFEDKLLSEIRKSDMARFVSARRKAGKRSKYTGGNTAVSDSTIIRDLQCASAIFTSCGDFDLCETNPANAYLKAMKNRGQLVNGPKGKRYLRHYEEEKLLKRALERAIDPSAIRRFEKFMTACAFALYIDTGMRADELLQARRSWVDLDQNQITIPAEVTKAKKERSIPLFPRARRIIEMLPANKHNDLLLWRTSAGKAFADLNKTLQAIAREAGVAKLKIHDLRRTCGCRLLQDHRMTMAEVSRWLGHATTDITEAAYAFLETENLHDAIGGRVIDNAARLRLAELLGPDDTQAVLDGYLGATGNFRKQLLEGQAMPTKLIAYKRWPSQNKKG